MILLIFQISKRIMRHQREDPVQFHISNKSVGQNFLKIFFSLLQVESLSP